MVINTHSNLVNKPINSVTSVKKPLAQQNVSALPAAPVSEKPATFSLQLSAAQQQNLHNSIGYDQPSAKQRGAISAYQQVSVQAQREAIMNSMSFHFVV